MLIQPPFYRICVCNHTKFSIYQTFPCITTTGGWTECCDLYSVFTHVPMGNLNATHDICVQKPSICKMLYPPSTPPTATYSIYRAWYRLEIWHKTIFVVYFWGHLRDFPISTPEQRLGEKFGTKSIQRARFGLWGKGLLGITSSKLKHPAFKDIDTM